MKAAFIEPMLLERCSTLPESDAWLVELKLDGFRAIGFKSGGKVYLRSRNDKDFNSRYPDVVKDIRNFCGSWTRLINPSIPVSMFTSCRITTEPTNIRK